ncbi:MAG: hypothetical protein SYR96_25115 [Actinomycetota bacterium]|nr:hypothetical protein [Actinomycetota bacterium]
MPRLIAENTHRLSTRPWLLVTGRLEGEALRIGDELSLAGSEAAVVVRAIELHGALPKTTVAADGDATSSISEGAVLVRV